MQRVLASQVRASSRRERGALLTALGPLVAALAVGELALPLPHAPLAAVLGGGAALMVAGALLPRRPRTARALATTAWLVGVAALAPRLVSDPAAVVRVGLATLGAGLFFLLDPVVATRPRPRTLPTPRSTARTAAALVTLGWTTVVLRGTGPVELACVAAAAIVASALVLRALGGLGSVRRRALVVATLLLGVAGAVALWQTSRLALSTWVAALLLTIPAWEGQRAESETMWSRFFAHPARLFVVTFAALAMVSALLLALPASDSTGTGIGLLDAAFTAVSASCVTGLIVLDTPSAFSGFGEAILLLTIQVGGLGIMSFYTFAFAIIGRRLSIREERALTSVLQLRERAALGTSVRNILSLTLGLEAAGAVVLTLAFHDVHGQPWGAAAWRGVFTAVSAFCNAGFALDTTSLMPYATDPIVVHTVALLVVVGGLSPLVAFTGLRALRGERPPLHVSLALITTGVALAAGFGLFALMEWRASLAGFSVADKLHNAWFQSVTPRTAGFNTVDLLATEPATRALLVALMFVGGTPGGTAGGAKTTTVAVLVLTVVATMRKRRQIGAFGRSLSGDVVHQAATVVVAGVVTGFVALLALQLTQAMPAEALLFEVVSALGTVGLSLDVTPHLDEFGKVVVMACMFAGRVGPLALVLLVSDRLVGEDALYPEAKVEIG